MSRSPASPGATTGCLGLGANKRPVHLSSRRRNERSPRLGRPERRFKPRSCQQWVASGRRRHALVTSPYALLTALWLGPVFSSIRRTSPSRPRGSPQPARSRAARAPSALALEKPHDKEQQSKTYDKRRGGWWRGGRYGGLSILVKGSITAMGASTATRPGTCGCPWISSAQSV